MVKQGADWIKTTHTDKALWLDRPDPPVFDDSCFEALVEEARKHNRPVAMHQTQTTGFRKALELHVDSMEHAPLDSLTDEDIKRMVDRDIPIVPTMRLPGDFLVLDRVDSWMTTKGATYLGHQALRATRALLEHYRQGIPAEIAQKGYHPNLPMIERQFPVLIENVRRIHASGGTIGCGTDSGGGPFAVFGRIGDEIDYLVEAGLSSFQALRSATAENARILRLDDKLGTLEQGKLADFVAVDGNPLSDIKALRRVRKVIKEGEVILSQ
jgi:imidazolonepropionase-like amidohydrolase